jgi:hypothetical protein
MKKLIIGFAITTSLFAFSPKQKEIAEIVYNEWSEVEINGEIYPATGVAICKTETWFGTQLLGDMDKNVLEASLGIMQVRIPTARLVSRVYDELAFLSELSDRQLVNRLIIDHKLNAKVAAYYFKWCFERYKTYFKSVSAYNGGLKNTPYYNRVMKNRKITKSLIKEIKGE